MRADLTREFNHLFGDVLADMERDRLETLKRRALADPAANANAKVFDGPMRWCFYGQRGVGTRFCYSTMRNVAGYYLTWREDETADGKIQRDRFSGHKLKRAAKALALRCYEQERAR